MAIPAGDTAAYPAARLLSVVAFVVVMLYDQHWSRARPGPIADPDWVRRWLAVRVAEGGAARVVAGLPVYGYQWSPDSTKAAATVGFDDARRISAQAGIRLVRDSASATLHATSAGKWDIWIPDAVLLERLVRVTGDLGVRRVALWRLGLEDDAIWSGILARTSQPR
jgi:spore germination protein YaaH